MHNNNVPESLKTNPKLFADETSIFCVFKGISLSQFELREDLTTTYNGTNQWELSFNSDPSKQATDVTFSRKTNRPLHLRLVKPK